MSLLKDHYLGTFASRFQSAGIACLVYDHRGWGSSGGLPRNQTDPLQQAEDYHDAVTFAASLPSVDSKRVAIWGIGHSGGAAMISAGDDPRIKAVVLVMPFTSGGLESYNYPTGLVKRAWAEREKAVAKQSLDQEYIPLWDNSREEALVISETTPFLHGVDAFDFINGAKKLSDLAGNPWKNLISLQSFYLISRVEPGDWIKKISPRPILYIAAKIDPLSGPVEQQQKTFDKAGEPKEWVLLDDHHIANYFGKPFEVNISKQIDFLKRHL